MPSGTFAVSNNSYGMNTEIRWWTTDEPWNNRTLVSAELWARRNSSTTFGNGSWSICIAGNCANWSGSKSVGTSWVHIIGHSVWVGHDAAGAASAYISASGGIPGTSWTSTSGGQWVGLTNYVVLPYAPYNLSIRAGTVTTSSFGVDYARSSHDALDRPDQAQWATDAGFGNVVWQDEGPQGYSNPAGFVSLAPGTTHYVRIRSHTSAGWGPWSSTISQTTLPATAPGFSVSASPSGTEAYLTFSPPGGVSGVTKYQWERRVYGTTTPVSGADITITTATVGGLTPGVIYEWRGSAWIGSYQSPWTGWTLLSQPAPNTNTGAYFDGGTPASGDTTYAWSGPANASYSTASAAAPLGWSDFFSSAGASGGTGVVFRATGGIYGSYAARALFWGDATGAGFILGPARIGSYFAEVEPNEVYYGSIFVRPSRTQRMRAKILFYNAGGGFVGEGTGTAQSCPGVIPTRLIAVGTAPLDAAYATVVSEDQTGTDWSVWRGGEFLDTDGAMVSHGELFDYFDGSLTNTPLFLYAWEGAEHNSLSTRLSQEAPTADLLADPDCEPVPAPPAPPTIDSACITDIGTWRRYRVPIPGVHVRRWASTLPTLILETGAEPERQVRVRVFANPDELLPDEVVTDEWMAELILTYIPPYTKLTLDSVTQRVWAEVDGSEPIPANHLLYGTDGVPAVWPELRCGTAYLFALDVPLDTPAGNLTTRVLLTQRM